MVRLWISGVPDGVSSEAFASRFSDFGTVSDVEIVVDDNGSSKGFGYITLEADEAAIAKCQNIYNNTRWGGNVVRVAPAKPKYTEKLESERKQEEDEAATNAAKLKKYMDALTPEGIEAFLEKAVRSKSGSSKHKRGWKRGRFGRPAPVMKLEKPKGRGHIVYDPVKYKDAIVTVNNRLHDPELDLSELPWTYGQASVLDKSTKKKRKRLAERPIAEQTVFSGHGGGFGGGPRNIREAASDSAKRRRTNDGSALSEHDEAAAVMMKKVESSSRARLASMRSKQVEANERRAVLRAALSGESGGGAMNKVVFSQSGSASGDEDTNTVGGGGGGGSGYSRGVDYTGLAGGTGVRAAPQPAMELFSSDEEGGGGGRRERGRGRGRGSGSDSDGDWGNSDKGGESDGSGNNAWDPTKNTSSNVSGAGGVGGEDGFDHRDEFAGEAGRELLSLQRSYKGDERFKLTPSFLPSTTTAPTNPESGDGGEGGEGGNDKHADQSADRQDDTAAGGDAEESGVRDAAAIEREIQEEKARNWALLGEFGIDTSDRAVAAASASRGFGSEVSESRQNLTAAAKKRARKKTWNPVPRYDPDASDASDLELDAETVAAAHAKNLRGGRGVAGRQRHAAALAAATAAESSGDDARASSTWVGTEAPEVSKDKFYSVKSSWDSLYDRSGTFQLPVGGAAVGGGGGGGAGGGADGDSEHADEASIAEPITATATTTTTTTTTGGGGAFSFSFGGAAVDAAPIVARQAAATAGVVAGTTRASGRGASGSDSSSDEGDYGGVGGVGGVGGAGRGGYESSSSVDSDEDVVASAAVRARMTVKPVFKPKASTHSTRSAGARTHTNTNSSSTFNTGPRAAAATTTRSNANAGQSVFDFFSGGSAALATASSFKRDATVQEAWEEKRADSAADSKKRHRNAVKSKRRNNSRGRGGRRR